MLTSKDILNKIADIYVSELETAAKQANIPANSRLIKSIKAVVDTNSVTVYANDYYKWVESGRKPNQKGVPIKALEEWIVRYSIASKVGWQGSIKSLAFAVQNSIKRKGIKGKPFTKKAYDRTTDIVNEYIDTQLSKDIDKQLSTILE